VTCAAGFEPSVEAGSCQVSRDCVPDGPGASKWAEGATCNPVECSPFTGTNYGTASNTFDFETGEQTQTQVCASGYAADGAGSFVATCDPDGPCDRTWNNVKDCVCVDCAPLQVVNSNTAEAVSGYCTTETHVVDCDDGYCAGGSDTFTATCIGDGPATVTWDTDTCDPVACPTFTLANSNYASSGFNGVTGDWTEVSCDEGYHSNDCTSWIMTCEASGPCASTWDHLDMTCEPDVVESEASLPAFDQAKVQI
jgi:hypothetical protein